MRYHSFVPPVFSTRNCDGCVEYRTNTDTAAVLPSEKKFGRAPIVSRVTSLYSSKTAMDS